MRLGFTQKIAQHSILLALLVHWEVEIGQGSIMSWDGKTFIVEVSTNFYVTFSA